MAVSVYSDLNQYEADKQALLTGVYSIMQSITNIISTLVGQRFFLPEFGSQIPTQLFDLMTQETEMQVLNAIVQAIGRWEPRVSIVYNQCKVTALQDVHTYEVTLAFKIKGYDPVDKSMQYWTGKLLRS